MRKNGRKADELREIKITKHYISHPEGSVLVEFGNTKVICNATIENTVPRFLKGKNMGWVTAEYGMLPRSTNERMRRESKVKQSGPWPSFPYQLSPDFSGCCHQLVTLATQKFHFPFRKSKAETEFRI